MRIVTYYAVWVAVCALVGGVVVAGANTLHLAMGMGIDQWIVYHFLGGAATVGVIALGQGVVALVSGIALHALGRTLRATVLLGVVIGLFDLAMYLVQWLIPATELGWSRDFIILAAVVAVVTAVGSVRRPA
jgi:hypothetical protein